MKTLTQRAYTEAVIEEVIRRISPTRDQVNLDDVKAIVLEQFCREAAISLSADQISNLIACVCGGLSTQAPFETIFDGLKQSIPAFEQCREYFEALRDQLHIQP